MWLFNKSKLSVFSPIVVYLVQVQSYKGELLSFPDQERLRDRLHKKNTIGHLLEMNWAAHWLEPLEAYEKLDWEPMGDPVNVLATIFE